MFSGDLVTCTHRDVCATGFGLEDIADAIFLDLPSPWDALPYAKQALKKSGWLIQSTQKYRDQLNFHSVRPPVT